MQSGCRVNALPSAVPDVPMVATSFAVTVTGMLLIYASKGAAAIQCRFTVVNEPSASINWQSNHTDVAIISTPSSKVIDCCHTCVTRLANCAFIRYEAGLCNASSSYIQGVSGVLLQASCSTSFGPTTSAVHARMTVNGSAVSDTRNLQTTLAITSSNESQTQVPAYSQIACGGTFTGKGDLTSPGYPSPYPNNVSCSYLLSAQSTNDNIVITFKTFNTEANYDILIINSWPTRYSPFYPYYRISGGDCPSTLILGNHATLHFTSDLSDTRNGFFATFHSVPSNSTISTVSGYGGNIFSEGNISSPNYPNKFLAWSWCNWSISAESGSELIIQFVDLDIINGSGEVFISTDGKDARYSGSVLPLPIRGASTANIQLFSNNTRSSFTGRGFKIYVYSTNSTADSSNLTSAESINSSFTAGSFRIDAAAPTTLVRTSLEDAFISNASSVTPATTTASLENSQG